MAGAVSGVALDHPQEIHIGPVQSAGSCTGPSTEDTHVAGAVSGSAWTIHRSTQMWAGAVSGSVLDHPQEDTHVAGAVSGSALDHPQEDTHVAGAVSGSVRGNDKQTV